MARILVLDRTSSVREALALILEMEGHSVVSAATGGDALAHLRASSFDVVLVDTHLRDLTFSDFCLSARAAAPRTRLVTMSMNRAAADDFEPCAPSASLTKPFPAPTLLAAVA